MSQYYPNNNFDNSVMATAGSKEDIFGRLKSHYTLKVIINVAENFFVFSVSKKMPLPGSQ